MNLQFYVTVTRCETNENTLFICISDAHYDAEMLIMESIPVNHERYRNKTRFQFSRANSKTIQMIVTGEVARVVGDKLVAFKAKKRIPITIGTTATFEITV